MSVGYRRRATWRALGMTILELQVGLAVSALVLVAVGSYAVQQSKSSTSDRQLRQRQSNARFALDYLERSVRQAGFAIDPQFAFDFDFYRCKTPAGSSLNYATASCGAADPVRDASSGPDELVVYTRNPNYQVGSPIAAASSNGQAWVITAAESAVLTLSMKAGDSLGMGQVLQLMCPGASIHTYVTVGQTVDKLDADGTVSVQLATGDSTPFFQNDVITSIGAAGCFASGTAVAYRVDRMHFFILTDTNANLPSEAQGQAARPRTYLVIDTGTDRNLDGEINDTDLIPIAPDIVDLQVAYLLTNGGVWGDGAGEELTADITRAPLTAELSALPGTRPCASLAESLQAEQSFGRFNEPCLLDKSLTDDYRQLNYPGNIRAVRISLVARTEGPLPGRQSATFFPPGEDRSLENRPSFALATGMPDGFSPFFPASATDREAYGFEILQTTVTVPNMLLNGHFMF